MKKLIAFVLAASLSLVSLTSAFAAETSEVSAAVNNQTENQQSVVAPDTVLAQYAYVNTDGVRMRATPGLSGTVLMILNNGYVCNDPYGYSEVYKDGYWWHYVSYNGTFGWVASIYLDFE